jgi:hypothetical protein
VTTLLSAGELAAWPCMSPEEYELWRLGSAKIPCVDCPLWFALQARAAGRCCGVPRGASQPGRPRTRPSLTFREAGSLGGRGHGYATDEERLAARRESWRESKRRARVASTLSAGAQ